MNNKHDNYKVGVYAQSVGKIKKHFHFSTLPFLTVFIKENLIEKRTLSGAFNTTYIAKLSTCHPSIIKCIKP